MHKICLLIIIIIRYDLEIYSGDPSSHHYKHVADQYHTLLLNASQESTNGLRPRAQEFDDEEYESASTTSDPSVPDDEKVR